MSKITRVKYRVVTRSGPDDLQVDYLDSRVGFNVFLIKVVSFIHERELIGYVSKSLGNVPSLLRNGERGIENYFIQ